MSRVEVLPPARESPAAARMLVRTELAGCNEEDVEAVELMISELVTNAVVHGSVPIRIEIEHNDYAVRAVVTDAGPRMPVLRQAQTSTAHGRGLKVVSSLAHDWGVDESESGKSVWFTLSCPSLDSPSSRFEHPLEAPTFAEHRPFAGAGWRGRA
jgi:anti-sigma regulatory factor (Ser/Thr protein kinase)